VSAFTANDVDPEARAAITRKEHCDDEVRWSGGDSLPHGTSIFFFLCVVYPFFSLCISSLCAGGWGEGQVHAFATALVQSRLLAMAPADHAAWKEFERKCQRARKWATH
jgi:hypothetical protein